MMRFEEENPYPHKKAWDLIVDIIKEDCPLSFSISMICYGLVALLCQMILPHFFNIAVVILKIEWPVLDPVIMFWWTAVGYLTVFLISMGTTEFIMGLGRWVTPKQ